MDGDPVALGGEGAGDGGADAAGAAGDEDGAAGRRGRWWSWRHPARRGPAWQGGGMSETPPVVVVTGANGLVGARVCAALVERGATVRAVVRRPGTAPRLDGVEERVGDFTDPDVAADVVAGASAVVTTVHPMGSDRATQQRGRRRGHLDDRRGRRPRRASTGSCTSRPRPSTTARRASATSTRTRALVVDDAGDYPVTKRDTDVALAGIDGLTRVLLRPPAILGPGESSIWNTLRPATIRDDERARHANPDATFAWVHVDDLAALRGRPRLRPGRHLRPTRGRARSRGSARPSTSPPVRPPTATTTAPSPAPSASSRSGRTARLDRPDPRRPRPRLGLDPVVDLTALAEIDAGLRG